MRNAFADEVTKLANLDPRITLLSGDIGNRLFDKLRAQSPDQFLNCGIAEQNMMGVAAGMGLSGLRPIIYTITPFTTLRCLEQIKLDVAYHRSPVIIVGTGSGLSYASLGPSHHSLEDFAILRAIPNLQIFAPWDAVSLKTCLNVALKSERPTYIRIGKKGESNLCLHQIPPDIGGGLYLHGGKHTCILAVGTLAHEACKAGKTLRERGVDVEVVLTYTVKPTPTELFDALLKQFDNFVIVEEHSSIGGFGEMFLCHVAKRRARKQIICLGADDVFMPIVGSQSFAREYFGIDAKSIISAIENFY
jgi:transketolase